MSERCDPFLNYIKTDVKGAVRLLCVVSNFCSGVSMASSWPEKETNRGQFFNFTAWTGLILSIISLLIHSFNVFNRPGLQHWPWHKVETCYSMVWAFFYLVASSCVAAWANRVHWNSGGWKAAAVFGFVSCGVYIVLSWYSWNFWQHGSDTVDSSPSVYETGISYQNADGAVPYSGHRPGTDPFYPAPHQNNSRTVPMVTVTTPAKEARLEFVD
eukprot:TRINITY_DN12175_c0_g1_i1.p1 TRINITY_DN12175_c0_g1~~TRINITY_DN12175_c0_g1_i1.p1  ORF type:complete len:224 (-),score=30.03 TRINITY_DN12175_c0_g1_i1:84-725(-)